jgi:hypothetical protein
MIGRGKSITHAGSALAYASEKEKAVEIDRQLVMGTTPGEIEREFRLFQDFNTRCEKNTLAFVLSPTIEDGKKLAEPQLKQITRDFLKDMGLTEHQFVAYAHRDRKHQHIHLYVNRIDLTGKAYDDSFLSNRSSRAAETIALSMGLKTARSVQEELQAGKKQTKEVVLQAHTSVLVQRPDGIDEYTRLMQERGVETLLKRNTEGKLIGIQFQGASGEKIKASDVHRSLTANRLEATLSERYALQPPTLTHSKNHGLSR